MDQLTQKLKSGEMRIREVPLPALSAVMKKLDAYSPLGYSSAGEVGDGVTGFAVGSRIARNGGRNRFWSAARLGWAHPQLRPQQSMT